MPRYTTRQLADMPISPAIEHLVGRILSKELPLLGSNAKLVKSDKGGWLTKGLAMAPAKMSYRWTHKDFCADSSPGCRGGCLQFAGRNAWSYPNRLRIAKSVVFTSYPEEFHILLEDEVNKHIRACRRKGTPGAIRPNVLTDLPGLALWLGTRFEDVGDFKVYDYTKRLSLVETYLDGLDDGLSPLVHWTLSRSETNHDQVFALANRFNLNVAVVFDGKLPDSYEGFPVLDGDESDARFLESYGCTHVIGLKLKGSTKAKNHARKTGFAVPV